MNTNLELFKCIADKAESCKDYSYVKFQLDNQNNIIGFTFTNDLPKADGDKFIYVALEQFQTKEAKEILEEIDTLIG